MEKLKMIKHQLISCIEDQVTHLDTVDARELGEVVDMVKDLCESMYYYTITKAMEGSTYEHEEHHHHEGHEGRSGKSRCVYMTCKETHKDKVVKMKELEHYLDELSWDISEMIKDASPEEKQLVEKKLSALGTKIAM